MFGKVWFIGIAFCSLFLSCGMENPYETREKKCKFNCASSDQKKSVNSKISGPDRSKPRQTPALSASLDYWTKTLLAMNVKPIPSKAEDLLELVSQNPLWQDNSVTSLAGFLSSVQAEYKDVRSATALTDLTENEKCVVDGFLSKTQQYADVIEGYADFGKCVSLDALTRKENGSYKVYTEFEKAISIIQPSQDFWAEKMLDFDQGAFVAAITDSSGFAAADIEYSVHMTRPILSGYATIEDGKITAFDRSFSVFALGESADNQFKVKAEPSQGRITLNGTFTSIGAAVSNPKTQDSFEGDSASGYLIKYQFTNFGIHRSGIQMGAQLGFAQDATYSGFYDVWVNQLSFRVQATTGTCKATLRMLEDDGQWSDIGILDLCRSSS